MLTIIILCGVASSWLIHCLWQSLIQGRTAARTHECLPFVSSYPHLDPIGGIDLLVRTWRDFGRGELSEGMRRRHEKFGRTFRSRNLGRTCIYTIDPENIRTVTTSRAEAYGKSAWVDEAAKHVGRGVLMNEGAAWKRSRTMLKPIFAHATLDDPALVEPHVRELARAIVHGQAERGGPVEFQALATRFTLDVVTDFLFGKSTHCLSDNKGTRRDETRASSSLEAREFLAMVKEFELPSATFIAVGILAWIELLPSYRHLIRVVDGMKAFFRRQLEAIVSESGGGGGGGGSGHAVSAGTSCFRMMRDAGLPVMDIQGELQNIFFASFDTTAALLANIVDVLSRRQDVQQQLRDEIACLGGQPPTKQDLGKIRYLRFVILEEQNGGAILRGATVLRLYTPVTWHSRQAIADTALPRGGGADGQSPVLVPAGATVAWSTYALNRDPQYYGPDWAAFRPERWEHLKAGGSQFFMPFGSGPRACLGQQMALTEASYVLVRLLQLFPVIASADPRPFSEARAVSFYNGHGTVVEMR